MNSRARSSANRGYQGTKKERETLNKLQIDTTALYLPLRSDYCDGVHSHIRKIEVELNYG